MAKDSPRIASLGLKPTHQQTKKVRRTPSPSCMRPSNTSLVRRGVRTPRASRGVVVADARAHRSPVLADTRTRSMSCRRKRGATRLVNRSSSSSVMSGEPEKGEHTRKRCTPRRKEHQEASSPVPAPCVPPIRLPLYDGKMTDLPPDHLRLRRHNPAIRPPRPLVASRSPLREKPLTSGPIPMQRHVRFADTPQTLDSLHKQEQARQLLAPPVPPELMMYYQQHTMANRHLVRQLMSNPPGLGVMRQEARPPLQARVTWME